MYIGSRRRVPWHVSIGIPASVRSRTDNKRNAYPQKRPPACWYAVSAGGRSIDPLVSHAVGAGDVLQDQLGVPSARCYISEGLRWLFIAAKTINARDYGPTRLSGRGCRLGVRNEQSGISLSSTPTWHGARARPVSQVTTMPLRRELPREAGSYSSSLAPLEQDSSS